MPLPTLIFADENHEHPLLFQVLLKLLPRLKQLGYKHFYAESDASLDEVMKTMQTYAKKEKYLEHQAKFIEPLLIKMIGALSYYNEFFEDWFEIIKNILNYNDRVDGELHTHMMFNMDALQDANVIANGNKSLIPGLFLKIIKERRELKQDFQAAASAGLKLVNYVKRSMRYSAIDDSAARAETISCVSDPKSFVEAGKKNLLKRDTHMGAAYLQAEDGTVGYIGSSHAPGIQQYLIEHSSRQLVQRSYMFIDIMRAPQHFEKFVLPLSNMVYVEGWSKTPDVIADEIYASVQAKIAEQKLTRGVIVSGLFGKRNRYTDNSDEVAQTKKKKKSG